MTQSYELREICKIKTPFVDKFGIPRQSGLIKEAMGVLELPNDNFHRECLRGIEGFSHLWLSFIFHKVLEEGEKSLVRPPRLGGKEKQGVWATRSPHRPNHLGLTVCKLRSIDMGEKTIILTVEGIDLLDQTPIIDIKPYIPYADKVEASSAWVPEPESLHKMKVTWASGLKEILKKEEAILIEKVLEQDPRPSAQRLQKESYVFKIFDYQVRFKNDPKEFLITSIEPLN